MEKAKSLFLSQHFQEALDEYSIIEINEHDLKQRAVISTNKAICAFHLGHIDNALAYCNTSIGIDESNPKVVNSIGSLLENKNIT